MTTHKQCLTFDSFINLDAKYSQNYSRDERQRVKNILNKCENMETLLIDLFLILAFFGITLIIVSIYDDLIFQ